MLRYYLLKVQIKGGIVLTVSHDWIYCALLFFKAFLTFFQTGKALHGNSEKLVNFLNFLCSLLEFYY